MTSQLAEDIADLEKRIEAYKQRLRVTRSDMNGENAGYLARTLKFHQDAIARHLKAIQAIKHRSENGEQIIAETLASIKEMKARLDLLKNKRAIEKMVQLAERINQLTEFVNFKGDE